VDRNTRNNIQRATQAGRTLLERAFSERLEGTYDILLDGTISEEAGSHLSDHQKVIREKLVATMAHKRSTGLGAEAAVQAYLREAAFTTLNRFVALKMLEARKLVQECVSKGEDSSGFKEFTALAPGLVALEDKGYRLYIETLFDEIGQEVKVLFDRRDVASLLWPDRQTLLELLGILNAPELASVWAEDETIGWVYQYFNGDEERTKMRAESQAPRNSRELAVRNQFFTPRYVVQFLTDNTLGRTWYEMMQGDTQIAHLDYLVRRPNEVFLAEGESAPESDTDDSELSQEELLQQTVHVPFRKKKDPRDLHILDPACGSGHFLLYTFDLLITIFEEAWVDAGAAAFTATGTPLRADYESLEDLRRAMPELILRYNLHGVDIDPRAAQIAALALWMRAQRAYNQFEVDRAQRPPITKTNIVVAEPMPGDAELVDEFAASLKPAVLGDLFKKMVEEMKLAGELGSLLKIEESIAKAVKEAEEAHRKEGLFAEKLESQDFWDTADEKIIAALGSFVESAAGAGGVRRQLFAGDAAQGVAFIELMRKRFDVLVMNPPFGESALPAKEYTKGRYPHSAQDIFQVFVERATELSSHRARIGCLSARTGFFMGNSESWRSHVAWKQSLDLFADLGLGVLDEALVEAAAYILSVDEVDLALPTVATRHLSSRKKEQSLLAAIHSIRGFEVSNADVFFPPLDVIRRIPGSVFAYWAPAEFLRRFISDAGFSETVAPVRQGLATADDFRFARLRWEVPIENLGPNKRWHLFSKGGEYSPPYDDIHLVVDWANDGRVLRSRTASRVQNDTYYHRPGITYTVRTASAFAAKILPAGCVFSHNAQSWFHQDDGLLLASALFFLGRTPQTFMELAVGGGDVSTSGSAARRYTTAVVHSIPSSVINALAEAQANNDLSSDQILAAKVSELTFDETTQFFGGFELGDVRSVDQLAELHLTRHQELLSSALEDSFKIDQFIDQAMCISPREATFVGSEVGCHPCSYPRSAGDKAEICRLFNLPMERLVDAAVQSIGSRRWTTKKSYFVDRRTELICHILQCHPRDVAAAVASSTFSKEEWDHRLFSYLIGAVFKRSPIPGSRRSLAEQFARDPFHAFGAEGGEPNADNLSPSVFVDDPGHRDDLMGSFSQIGTGGFAGCSQALLDDLSSCLGHKDTGLLGYLRLRFFAQHVSDYSKSRRKAPIYWQLATPSASYSVWCYYHRLTRDTFFRVANDYVTPKVDHEERKLNTLRQDAGPDPSSKQRKEIDAQETFVAELRAFLTEVKRIAPLWNPNLNDGVIINFAPLWRLVPQHKAWQKECKKVWDKLVKGDYDWAHLAMHLWPERVVPKCQDDRSLAIAHGLEDDFWYEDDKEKWQKRNVDQAAIDALVKERSSPAVKAALEDLLAAPTPGGAKRRSRRGGAT